MIIDFNKFLNENIFTEEELDDLYSGNDNADMYNYGDDFENRLISKPINTPNPNNGVYTLELLKSRLNMVKIYPEYHNFIERIIKLMYDNNWVKISVPDNIDIKLSKVNNIHNLPERNRFIFLKSLNNIKLNKIKEMKYLKTYETYSSNIDDELKKYSIKDRINEIKPKKGEYYYIMTESPFMNSNIMYYYNEKIYSGKQNEVSKTIKSRGNGDPTQEEIDKIVAELKAENKKHIFKLTVGHKYGNWVVSGYIIKGRPEILDMEFAQIMVDSTIKANDFMKNKYQNK